MISILKQRNLQQKKINKLSFFLINTETLILHSIIVFIQINKNKDFNLKSIYNNI